MHQFQADSFRDALDALAGERPDRPGRLQASGPDFWADGFRRLTA